MKEPDNKSFSDLVKVAQTVHVELYNELTNF